MDSRITKKKKILIHASRNEKMPIHASRKKYRGPSALVIALLNRFVYRFVIPLRYTSYCFYKVLKRLCNVSTRRFNKLCLTSWNRELCCGDRF